MTAREKTTGGTVIILLFAAGTWSDPLSLRLVGAAGAKNYL